MQREMRAPACVRSRLYAALAEAFCGPEVAPDDGGSLAQTLWRAAVAVDATALGRIADNLVSSLEIPANQAESAVSALEIEYNRLFFGPERPQAPPYESFYRDRWGVLMGPSARDVERCYAEAGLALVPHRRDLPDHVATELGFMAYLTMQELETKGGERQTWLERERSFLRDHLSAWLPPFCRRVQEAGQHPFYAALAELTATFVDLDTQRLLSRQVGELESDESTSLPASQSTDLDPRGQVDR